MSSPEPKCRSCGNTGWSRAEILEGCPDCAQEPADGVDLTIHPSDVGVSTILTPKILEECVSCSVLGVPKCSLHYAKTDEDVRRLGLWDEMVESLEECCGVIEGIRLADQDGASQSASAKARNLLARIKAPLGDQEAKG